MFWLLALWEDFLSSGFLSLSLYLRFCTGIIHSSTHPCTYLIHPMYPSVYPSIHSLCPLTPSTHLSTHLPMNPLHPPHPPAHSSTHLSVHLSIHRLPFIPTHPSSFFPSISEWKRFPLYTFMLGAFRCLWDCFVRYHFSHGLRAFPC